MLLIFSGSFRISSRLERFWVKLGPRQGCFGFQGKTWQLLLCDIRCLLSLSVAVD